METKVLTAAELRERMRRTGVTQTDLAREARLYQSDLSALLHGRDCLGPVRKARIEAAIVKLGLDKPLDPGEPEPERPAVVFRITSFR